MRLKIGIIVCEDTVPALRKIGIRSQAKLYEEWLGKVDGAISFRTFLAYSGRLPSRADECEAYIVGGSRHDIDPKQVWQPPLFNFLRVTAKAQIPVVGLGFGSQAVAHALGGRAASAAAWSIGRTSWKLVRDEGWLSIPGKSLTLQTFSRNMVVKLPSRSIRVASSSSCPNAAFRVANHSIGIHGHPEYTPATVEALLDARAEDVPDAVAKAARASLGQGPADAEAVADWAVHFAYRG